MHTFWIVTSLTALKILEFWSRCYVMVQKLTKIGYHVGCKIVADIAINVTNQTDNSWWKKLLPSHTTSKSPDTIIIFSWNKALKAADRHSILGSGYIVA